MNFRKGAAERVGEGAGFGPAQHAVGAEQAGKTQHGFADHCQVMCGVKKGNALTGQDLTAKTPNQDTQESNFIPKDNALGGFQTLAFGGRKVIGIKAMLDRVRVTGLSAALSDY